MNLLNSNTKKRFKTSNCLIFKYRPYYIIEQPFHQSKCYCVIDMSLAGVILNLEVHERMTENNKIQKFTIYNEPEIQLYCLNMIKSKIHNIQ